MSESKKKLKKSSEEQKLSKWISIFPPKQNDYNGNKASVIFLIIMGCVYLFRSLVHTFAPDGGAGIIAGYNIEAMGSADMVLWAWAWSGAYQILFTIVIWLVIIRYRRYISLIYVLIIIETILLRVISIIKPLTETLPEHTPPGVIGYVFIPIFTIIFFILSLRKSSKK